MSGLDNYQDRLFFVREMDRFPQFAPNTHLVRQLFTSAITGTSFGHFKRGKGEEFI